MELRIELPNGWPNCRSVGPSKMIAPRASTRADSTDMLISQHLAVWYLAFFAFRGARGLPWVWRCWEETEEAYGARLKEAASYINSTHDVEGLCMEFPGRLRDLVERNGDRLAK